MNAVRKCVVAVAALLLVSWIGYSAYNVYDSGKEPTEVQIDYQALDDFSQNITDAGAEEAPQE